jgi:hypothetical protein
MGMLLPTPRQRPREETVIAKTVLRFPDGTPMPTPPSVPPPKTRAPAASQRARFRVSPPPMLRRPR